jgi:hypothetical protein
MKEEAQGFPTAWGSTRFPLHPKALEASENEMCFGKRKLTMGSPPAIHRNTLLGPLGGGGDVTHIQKPSQMSNPWHVHPRFKSPNFLCAVLFLMAVAIGVVAAATFFWPCMPDPAMTRDTS